MGRTARHDQIAREMMTSDDNWCQDFLPLKRWKNGRLELARLPKPIRHITHPVVLSMGDRHWTYSNVEACIADGWEVD
jgi:hypothetical protein